VDVRQAHAGALSETLRPLSNGDGAAAAARLRRGQAAVGDRDQALGRGGLGGVERRADARAAVARNTAATVTFRISVGLIGETGALP
jgi:hypothetical protein